jgi:uncharacterized membrane protein YeaQ/YmgE (transglycosylase-associated protein family)
MRAGVAMFSFLWFCLIGICAGWLAGRITKGEGFGLLANLIIGVIGAILGGFLFRLLGFGIENSLAQLITATVGAILLLMLLRWAGRKA